MDVTRSGLPKRSLPDVVLMDIRMPAMDGIEATRAIKSRWPSVRVVAVTLYEEHRAEALAAGADAFLIKGCSPEELIGAILDGQAPGGDAVTG